MTTALRFPACGLYYGDVMHHRFKPKRHILKYRIFSLLVDLDRIDELDRASRLLSVNKFNLISFYVKDHGDPSSMMTGGLKQYVCNEVTTRLSNMQIGKVFLLAMPRVLGYVFNPLSIYFCYDEKETLRAVLYEVSNTFGQRHNYIFEISEANYTSYTHECAKTFYVSPFLDMDLQYKFTISRPTETFSLAIQALRNNDIMMNAVQSMTFAELSDMNLARTFASIPFMTIKVIAGIHLEALRLWLKGVSLVPNTSPVDKATRFLRDQGR